MTRSGAVRRALTVGFLVAAPVCIGLAQTPAGRVAAPVAEQRVYANMLQLMRGVLYPASNVVFTAQSDDPAAFKPAARPSTSSDPFTSAYGGWEAVENAGLALVESANLLVLPRACGNGRPAPVNNADWKLWVQQVRDSGVAAYKAGVAKDADAILVAAGEVSDSCLNCHRKYRNVPGGIPNRC